MHRFSSPGWARARTAEARPGNLAVGIALGSGYQARFAALGAAAQQAEIARMRAAGITWVRIDAEWWTVQPSGAGGYDWTVPDRTADALLAGGMNLVVLLNTSPDGGRLAPGAAPLASPWRAVDPQGFARFCAAAAAHYGPKGVHVYEVWNEPNLDSGKETAAGWGHLSPWGYADLAVAAFPAITAADPKAYVLGGGVATHPAFGVGGDPRTASWSAVPAGATSASVSCPGALAEDAYRLFTAAGWPPGTVVAAVRPGSGWTLVPPLGRPSFDAVPAGTGAAAQLSTGYPPDVFLAQAYARAAGRPMWHALAVHPYTQPALPAAHDPKYGGFGALPALRQLMTAHGEGAKPIWITEVGAPTGAAAASWSAAPAGATELVVACATAAAADLGYRFLGPAGFPTAEGWVSAVRPGVSWTLTPPTGLLLDSDLPAGTATASLPLRAPAGPVAVPAGTRLTVVAATDRPGVTEAFAVRTTSPVTVSATPTAVPVATATPAAVHRAGSPVRGALGQTWGAPVAAGTAATVKLVAPGVAAVPSTVDEQRQADIVAQVFRALTVGVPPGGGMLGAGPWPYVGPVFLYCWSDDGGGAGPFGLVRVDGTAKAALAALTALTATGGG